MTAHSIWASMVVLALCNPVLASERAVWIDADPSCAIGPTHDVDDCWAIIAALRADSLQIIGLSTVFGNTDVAKATATAQALLEIVQTHEPGRLLPIVTQGARLPITRQTEVPDAVTELAR